MKATADMVRKALELYNMNDSFVVTEIKASESPGHPGHDFQKRAMKYKYCYFCGKLL